MSRGFVKEGDQEEPPIIPPRADLPDGVKNYVTLNGHQELLQEREGLEKEKKNLPTDEEKEHRRKSMIIDAKLNRLNERIASARIVEPENQPKNEVRLGAVVKFDNGRKVLEFQIVGVDEADFKQKKIPFTAPIARALTGRKVGETAEFKRGDQVRELKILEINYPE